MKPGLTEIAFIIDKSGSMYHLTDDTLGGFNSVINEQKTGEGDVYITTVLFSNNYKVVHDHIDIKDVPPMTTKEYKTAGRTALLDSIGYTIDNIGTRLANTPENERPSKVMVFIITDGQENASVKYSKSKIKEMIEHQTNIYNWSFVFLGANMDAVSEGKDIGITLSGTYSASSAGIYNTYTIIDEAIKNTREYTTNLCSVNACCSSADLNYDLESKIAKSLENIC